MYIEDLRGNNSGTPFSEFSRSMVLYKKQTPLIFL